MKIQIENSFLTDNSKEVTKDCFFIKTKSNSKYLDDALLNEANILSINEVKKIFGIKKDIKIIGICGTNGKTTTSMAIYKTLLDLKYRAFVCGTSGAFMNGIRIDEKGLTTNSILKTLNFLKIASEKNCDFFIMEVSSHAIDQDRIEGIEFDLKIFTNISQDHLDYHKSMQNYIYVKSSFFADNSLKLINLDDKNLKFNKINSKYYSLEQECDFYSLENETFPTIKAFINNKFKFNSYLFGKFNLYNLLAAFGAIKLLSNKSDQEILNSLSKFKGAKGRVEIVSNKPFIIIDFAHTPDGMEKILSSIKADVITIFGAGGNRDNTKRPLMGAIAKKYSKFVIITNDNPRDENDKDIAKQILSGIKDKKNVDVILDRKLAIKEGIKLAKQHNFVLLILGKGDEDYQEIKGCKYHFSDKEVVKEFLNIG